VTLGGSRNRSGWIVVVLAIATAFSALLSVTNIAVRDSMITRAADNRDIEASFKQTDRIVAAFKTKTGHLPSYDGDYPTPIGDVAVVDPSIAGWDSSDVVDALTILGRPPKGGYLLTADWIEEPEFYASWSGQNTLSFNPDHYSVSGRLWLDVAVTWLITAMLAIAAVRAFVAWQPKRSKTS
jgi:hypothetical protein